MTITTNADTGKNTFVITTTTKQMYDTVADHLFDLKCPLYGSMVDMLNSLIMSDMEGIRRAFKDGNTFVLLPDHMDTIDQPGREDIEVRVTCSYTGKLIGIVIESELQY